MGKRAGFIKLIPEAHTSKGKSIILGGALVDNEAINNRCC
jgi:hypothetical protein